LGTHFVKVELADTTVITAKEGILIVPVIARVAPLCLKLPFQVAIKVMV
jgi:hypothetical protein